MTDEIQGPDGLVTTMCDWSFAPRPEPYPISAKLAKLEREIDLGHPDEALRLVHDILNGIVEALS